MRLGIGDAPCGNCGKHIYNIPIDLDSQKPDGEGGYWWKVVNNDHCLECGEPLNWYHKPAPIFALLPVRSVAKEE